MFSVVVKWIGCVVLAYVVLFVLSVIFMQGAFIELIGLGAIVLGSIIYRSIFKVRYMEDVD
jgi:hypothetical protein